MRPPRYHIITSDRIPAASGGYDQTSAPAYLRADKAAILRNMLTARAGKLLVRGGSRSMTVIDAGIPDLGKIKGIWTYDDKLLLTPDTNLFSYVNAPSGGISGSGGSGITSAWTKTAITDFTFRIGNASYDRLGGFVYGFLWNTAVVGAAPVFAKWDGSTAITKLANVPITAAVSKTAFYAVLTHLNRLFLLGDSNALYWTVPGWDGTDTLANWQDPVSGLTNKILLEGSPSDYGVGLARQSRRLLIFRRRSIMALSGTSPANFAVQRVASVGCISQPSIAEFNDVVFFMSDTGLMVYNGAHAQVVSSDVNTQLLKAALRSGSTTISTVLPGDRLSVLVIDSTNAPQFWGMYHVPSSSWTDLTDTRAPTLGSTNMPLWTVSAAAIPWAYDGSKSMREFYETGVPELITSGARHSDLSSDGTTENVIDARFRSRVHDLGTPERKATLNQLYCDYVLANTGTGNVEWQVRVYDGKGTQLAGPFHLPSDAAGNRQRAVLDIYQEVEQIQVDYQLVVTAAGAPVITSAEVHDTLLQFQFATERTG